jgi:hypothetical protein
MARGRIAPEGSEYIAQNGYRYRKVQGKWVSVHKLVVEEKLGRAVKDYERIRFKDGDKTNLSSDNLIVVVKGKTTLEVQLARLIARRDELSAQIEEVRKEIELAGDKQRLEKLEKQKASDVS